jgi:septum site-determining protein MinC
MKKNKSIEFKGTVATFSALTVTLRSNDIAALKKDLHELCGATPDFFNEDIALLDAAALPGEGTELDWSALVAELRAVRLNPTLVRHAAKAAEDNIRRAGLNLAEEIEIAPRKASAENASQAGTAPPEQAATNPPAAPTPQPQPDPAPPAEVLPPIVVHAPVPAMVIDRPLRSGQQVYAKNADLVILAMVNPGAEVMADGNIHVYAPLRGRALAGASGNVNARILTTCFEAELVSIGGVYRPLDPGMPKEVSGKPAQVRLVDDEKTGKQTLLIEALKIG